MAAPPPLRRSERQSEDARKRRAGDRVIPGAGASRVNDPTLPSRLGGTPSKLDPEAWLA
jgi:hypothetical protein